MIAIPNICYESSRIRQWRSGECPSQKSKDEDRSCILGQGATDLESNVGDECNDEDWASPKDFG
jgi:hypothetical protein